MRRQLGRLGSDEAYARRWCAADITYVPLVRQRAQRASQALRGIALRAPADLHESLQVVAILFDAGLFFEVHELLEPHWRRASGDARDALRGLIQIAAGYHHGTQGNLTGAGMLLAKGAAQVRSRRLGDILLEGFGAAVAGSTSRVASARPAAPPFPSTPPSSLASRKGRGPGVPQRSSGHGVFSRPSRSP